MADNPYIPPKSDVRDVGPDRLLAERPRQVVHATLLLWISFVLAVPVSYWEYRRAPEDTAAAVLIFIALVLVLVIAVNIGVWRGRNWARVVFLAFLVLSIVIFLGTLGKTLEHPVIEIVLNVIGLAIDGIVAYLLLTKPGSLWFRSTGR
jgi:hypothetical protein